MRNVSVLALLTCGVLLSVALLPARRASGEPPGAGVGLGDKVGNLSFKDIRYLPRSLDDFKDRKAFVLAFTTTTCPLVQRYLPVLQDLEREYRGRSVQFLAVNVGADDSVVQMAAQAVKHDMEFPFVKDFGGQVAAAVGAKRTPEVVVLDAERRLRYRGRIDDQYRLGGTRAEPSRRDLKEALDAVLAGREVAVKETPVDGCLITFPEQRVVPGPVTYAEHVAPILRKHCAECHRPGTAAPFALQTYEQAASKASTLAEVVAEQRMPPWYASPEHGTFTNRRGLTAAERDLVIAWARGGRERGNESRLPPEPVSAKPAGGWLIGEPDLVLSAPEHELPASGDIPYKYVILPHIFAEDTWVRAVQIRPDNPRVVHHCNMAYVNSKEGFKGANFVTGTVPGGEPMTLDNGVGFCFPKGSALGLQIHYVSTGKPEKCRVSVGIKYASGKINKQLRHILLADYKFAIPPGVPAYRVTNSKTLDRDADGLALFVHMHLRGRDMTFRAYRPDGTEDTLLVVPNYNFDWQMPYRWAPGSVRFPKGTRLEAVAHYDNSPFNAFNPDPTAAVREGQQTRDEMMNGFVFFTYADEQLNLDIDPKTGRVKPSPGSKSQ
jgi:thiol-disulfide isomerase/thioredoxin